METTPAGTVWRAPPERCASFVNRFHREGGGGRMRGNRIGFRGRRPSRCLAFFIFYPLCIDTRLKSNHQATGGRA